MYFGAQPRSDLALVVSITTDVRQWADIDNVVTETVQRFGKLDIFVNNAGAASIVGTENMYLRMSASGRYAVVGQPTETFARSLKVMALNDESIQIIHPAAAHTDGDAIVLFRQSDVLLTGDVFDMTRFPVIDVSRGGSIRGEIEVLNQLIDLAIPSIPLPWPTRCVKYL